jgi:3',5'-cyclic AMP phosphodiesterase CpdA
VERRSIIHLSDIHFGRHSDQALEGVFQFIRSLPSPLALVIITGDLTQRAKSGEFRLAAEFLHTLQKMGSPVVVIPGNHDVSLYNPYLRFLKPFRAYDRFIGNVFPDSFEDEHLCVVGLRTNNLRRVAEGRLSRRHAGICRAKFELAPHKLKIVAVHHPLLESLASPFAREILGTGPNLTLAGHRHRYGIVKVQVERRTVYSLSAGTAISTRTRDEENGFNWIEYSPIESQGTMRSLSLGEDGAFSVKAEEKFPLPWAEISNAEQRPSDTNL